MRSSKPDALRCRKPPKPRYSGAVFKNYSFVRNYGQYQKITFLFSNSQAKSAISIRRTSLMGKAKRVRPARLGEKLSAIRRYFDCTLEQMAEKLSDDIFSVRRQAVSQYELNDNEPPLPILLRYARISGIAMEILVDDEIDLPGKFL